MEALRDLVRPEGYAVHEVPVRGALHLKTAVCEVASGVLLVNRNWLDGEALGSRMFIDVDPVEPFGANALRIGDRVIFPTAFPETAARLRAAGIELVMVDASELAKAEGGVTCCSLVFDGLAER